MFSKIPKRFCFSIQYPVISQVSLSYVIVIDSFTVNYFDTSDVKIGKYIREELLVQKGFKYYLLGVRVFIA